MYDFNSCYFVLTFFIGLFRKAQAQSLEWFYIKVKSRFRRHGGAKVVREFYKKKKLSELPEQDESLDGKFMFEIGAEDLEV